MKFNKFNKLSDSTKNKQTSFFTINFNSMTSLLKSKNIKDKVKINDILLLVHEKLNIYCIIKCIDKSLIFPDLDTVKKQISTMNNNKCCTITTGPYTIEKVNFHEHNLDLSYFDLVKNNQKKAELYVYNDKIRKIKTNDILIFFNNNKKIITQIKQTRIYSSIKEAIINDKENYLLPNIKSKSEIIDVYNNLLNCKDINKFGVIRFDFELLNEC